jgi:hypothetical protein
MRPLRRRADGSRSIERWQAQLLRFARYRHQ